MLIITYDLTIAHCISMETFHICVHAFMRSSSLIRCFDFPSRIEVVNDCSGTRYALVTLTNFMLQNSQSNFFVRKAIVLAELFESRAQPQNYVSPVCVLVIHKKHIFLQYNNV